MEPSPTSTLEELVPVDIEKEIDETDTISLGSQDHDAENDDSVDDDASVEDDVSVEDEHAEDEEGEEGEEGEEDEEGEEGKEGEDTNVATLPEDIPELSIVSAGTTGEETDEEDETDDENAFKKLEQDIQREYLEEYHPETKQINFNELLALSKVTRNGEGQIIDVLHKTIPFMTKYERTRILGLRTTQINNGSEIFVNVDKDVIDGYVIAEMELKEKKIPFIIRRPLPNGASEYWRVEDLEIINY